MKTSLHRLFAATLVGVAAVTTTLFAADTPAGFVDFGQFQPSVSADTFVEVKLSSGLLQLAAQLTRKHEPDVANLLQQVHSVRVNVVGLGDDNRTDTLQKATALRRDLEGRGWERIVNAQEKNQAVSVFLKTRNADTVEGLVVTVVENQREAVFVNIVGDVKVDQLAQLGDKLNLEPLKQVGALLEQKPATKKPAPESKK